MAHPPADNQGPQPPEANAPGAAGPVTDDHLPALECLLFVAREPVTISRLAEALQVEATEVPRLLARLESSLEGHGLYLTKLAGGLSLATRPEYTDYVHRLLDPDPGRLSKQALETLAIIAYRQPITRPEIEELRGVDSAGTVSNLLNKGLVRICGRKDAPGRPFLLETTPHFLSEFGLNDLEELPDLQDLRLRAPGQGTLPGPGREARAADD